MPIFRLKCNNCEIEATKLMHKRDSVMCECGGFLEPQLPASLNTVTKELKDPHRGVSHAKGLKKQLKERMTKHHDKHDLAQKVEDYGTDTMIRLKWDKKIKRI